MPERKEKLVYVPMVADYLHPGHLNIINVAATLGEVIVGLFSDKAVASYKRLPFMNYEQRKVLVENIKGVSRVVVQDEKDYEPNLRKYKPDYMVHGTDWRSGPLREVRQRAIDAMAEWGGEVVEPEYTQGISSTILLESQKTKGILPNQRLSLLRRLLDVKPLIKVMEAHNAISALIVENAKYVEGDQPASTFDAIWLSSLTDSTAKGKPDTEFVDLTSRMATVNDIIECTSKPIIYDGDTGGLAEHFSMTVKRLERLGVSAVIIEDKTGPKHNSLTETDEQIHTQDTVENFCAKIRAGKMAQINSDFMIIARLEGLILGAGMEDTVKRARAYIAAGADGIMIHSKNHDGKDVLEFCEHYKNFETKRPLVAVPTNYSAMYEDELRAAGINIVIYANQLLRAAYTGMEKASRSILKHKRAFEADQDYVSALELINMIKGNEIG
jgi:phosphoenolpyruvate phosphomutase